jgi:hypothetical protein
MAVTITNYKLFKNDPVVSIKKINISNRDTTSTEFNVNFDLISPTLNSPLSKYTIDVGVFHGTLKEIQKSGLGIYSFIPLTIPQDPGGVFNEEALLKVAEDTRTFAADSLSNAPFLKRFRNDNNVINIQLNPSDRNFSFAVDNPKNVIMIFFVSFMQAGSPTATILNKGSVSIGIPFLGGKKPYEINGTIEREALLFPVVPDVNTISKIQDQRFFDDVEDKLNFNPATRHDLTTVQKRVKESNFINVSTNQMPFRNNYQHFSDLLISQQVNNSINGYFFVNIKNILLEYSSYPFILKDPELLDFVMSTYLLDSHKSIRITKTLTRKPTQLSEIKTSEKHLGEFITQTNNFSTDVNRASIKNVTNIVSKNIGNLTKNGIQAFSFNDQFGVEENTGRIVYQLLMDLNDPTVLLLNDVYRSLKESLGAFDLLKTITTPTTNLGIKQINKHLAENNYDSLDEIFDNLSISLLMINTFNNELNRSKTEFNKHIEDLRAIINPRLSLEPDILHSLITFNQKLVNSFDNFILSIGKLNGRRNYNFAKTERKNFSGIETTIEIVHPFETSLDREQKDLFGYKYFKNEKSNFVSKKKIVVEALKQLSKILDIRSKTPKAAITELTQKYATISSNLNLLDTAFCYYTFNQFVSLSDKFEFNNNKDPLNDLKNNNLNYKLLFSDLSYDYANIFKEFELNENPHIKDTNNVSNLDVLDYNKLVLVLLTKLNFKFFTDQLTEDVDEVLTKVEIGNACAEAANANTRNNFNFSQNYNSEFITNFIEDNEKIINLILNYGLKDGEKINDYLNFVSNFNEDFIRNLINDKTLNSLEVPTHLKALILGLNSDQMNSFNENFKNKIDNNGLQDPFSYNTYNNNILFVKKLLTLRGFKTSRDFGLDLRTPLWAPVTLGDLQNKNVIFCKLEDYYNDKIFYTKNKIDKFKIFNQYFLAK